MGTLWLFANRMPVYPRTCMRSAPPPQYAGHRHSLRELVFGPIVLLDLHQSRPFHALQYYYLKFVVGRTGKQGGSCKE